MSLHVNWAKVAQVGLRVVSAIVSAAGTVEGLVKAIPLLKGKAKEDAAVELAKDILNSAEQVVGKDLLNDPEVEVAVRAFIQAYVALQNIVAVRAAAQAPAPQ